MQQNNLKYPATKTGSHVDLHHDIAVPDPYRWLEDDNSAETKSWVEAQNKVTFAYLDRIPQRETIRKRLTELWNYEKYGVPFKQGGRYFFSRNDGLQNQDVLLVTDSLDTEPRVLLDPNKLSADGTVALSRYSISEDGNLMAYGISVAGSDWQEWKVRDVRSGKDLDDHLKWVKFSSASWSKDNKGFYYSRYDAPKDGEKLTGQNYFQKVFYHQVGTSQSTDTLVYERPDHKEWGFGAGVTDDGKYLLVTIWQGTDPRNRVYYRDLSEKGGKVTALLDDFDADYTFVDNDGPVFYFYTDYQAPRGRVIAIDIRQPERANWRELIPEAKETLRGVNLLNDQFLCQYLKDAQSQVKVFDRTGKFVREIELPGIGSAGGFGGKRADAETFYSFTSFTTPGSIYRLDLKSGVSSGFKQPKVAFNAGDYETKQIFYRSKDGTRVPMFITHKKGLTLNGRNPTYLYGYGGFNISLTPRFSISMLTWMEMGGVYAQPSLRGGGEYGEEWHQAGTKTRKQNVFDDFISAAEWLCGVDAAPVARASRLQEPLELQQRSNDDNSLRNESAASGNQPTVATPASAESQPDTGGTPALRFDPPQRYTSPDKLAIAGGSNGGLLVGACMIQRPELYAAALPAVGVMDMLRFHKFTIGWAWTSDYGTPENPAEFLALHAYSPCHNLEPGVRYPSTLVTTADHDDRVVPAHSFKFAARLQACHAGKNPVLIRIETKAGHGAGKPTEKIIAETADKLGFLVKELKMN